MFNIAMLLELIFVIHPISCAQDPRFLVYTNGGVIKLVLGWGIPVHVPMSVIFAHNIQFQYTPIDNYTEVHELINNGITRSLSLTKYHFYSFLEGVLLRETQGECILHIICELAKTPIINSGIFGEILQLLFSVEENSTTYGLAWDLGKSLEDCRCFICPLASTILERISKIH